MLDSKKFSSEKQLNMSETWYWANCDIHLNNNHNGNNVSSTLTPQWNSNLPAYIDQTTLNNSSINIINPTTLSTINNNVLNTTTTTTTNTNTNLYKPAYSTKLYHTYQGDLEQNKCLNDFPNTNQIHLPSIESVRRLTHYDNNLNHIYNNELYSTCFYDNNNNHNQHDHLHKSEYNLPQITYHNNEQYEIDLQKLPKTNYDNYFINHERNNTNHIDRIIDYFPIINTDTNYLVSSTPNSLIHFNQIDQYTLVTCNEVKGNDNSSTIVHNNNNNNNNNNDNDNIINESKENSSLTIQQHLWDIKDLKLPKVSIIIYYSVNFIRVYAQTCERARRHQSGWAMRNTNNHNPQVLKKSCLGVLECSMNCMVQGKPLSLRPAICDKARKKQCNRECITPGCKGRLILRNCRGHSGYPVTHFWRFANGAVYFEAKGEHDHNRPSLKTFGLTESDTVTTNTTTNTINSHVTTTSTPTIVDKLVTGITTLISPDIDRNLNHITNNNNNIQYIHSQNLHLHDQVPQQQQPQPQQGCHDYRFLPQYEQSIIDQQNFTLSNEFCNYYNYQSSNHSQLDNSHLLSLNKTKHVGKRVTNRKVIRREKKLTNTHLKKQQKCENYYKKLSNESNCTLGDIKRNRKIQQNTRSDQINKFKIPNKTNENDNDQIFCDDPSHGDTVHNCYAINITNNNSWNNETINQIDSSLNQSIEKEQYNTTEMNTMNHSYYSDPLFTTTTTLSSSSSSPSSVTITTVNQHHSSLPFWNCIQDLDSYLSTNHNSSNYITNTMISTMYSSPNWSLSPSVLSSSSLSSSSTYSTCTTCALSLSSLSLCSTNVSTSLSKQILPDSTEVIQCNPLTESYHQITSTPNINCNESYFIQYNNCSYFDKSKHVSSSSSYNEYPQSVFINSMYREHEESNPVQFNDNDINEEIYHSTPQQPIYIDDYHYHYYYYYYYSNPCLSMSDQIVLNDPITTSSTITNSSIGSVNNDINTIYSTKSVNNYSMESLNSNHRQHYQQQEQQQQPTVQWSMNDMNDHRTEERLNESMEFMNQDEYDIEKSFNYYHFMLNSNMHQPINMNFSNESDKYGIVQGINDVHENVNENSLHEEEEEDDDDDDEEEGEEQVEDAHYNHSHPRPPPPPPHHHHNHQHQQQNDEFTFNQNLSEETTNWSNPYLHNSSFLPSSSSSSKEQISQFEQDLTIDNAKHHNFEECLPRTSNSPITITTTTTTTNSNTTCSNNNNDNVSTTDNGNDYDHSFPCEIHNYDNSFNYFIVNDEPVTIATTDHLLISHSHF
ncbi:unnamed protein product [Schistosoma mattheei]|uniref:Uncharacterized protein n=1 Tax=Schistosoma mattheei TaxID=31246 RepID=A0A183NRD7_9TREM|nr:unnamed protein product [Schistosoma mattheei]